MKTDRPFRSRRSTIPQRRRLSVVDELEAVFASNALKGVHGNAGEVRGAT